MSSTFVEITPETPPVTYPSDNAAPENDLRTFPRQVRITRKMACFLVDNGFLSERYTLYEGTLYTDSRRSERIPITRKMYYALYHADLIDTKTELLEGVIVAKMSQNQPHVRTLNRLSGWLMRQFGIEYIQAQNPIRISFDEGELTEPEPDIAVLKRDRDAYTPYAPPPEDVLLCVEIADITLRTDKIIKARLYARAEIAEYWIADTNSRTIIVHREPNNGEYQSVVTYTAEQGISCLAKPDALKKVDELLAPATNETAPDTVR